MDGDSGAMNVVSAQVIVEVHARFDAALRRFFTRRGAGRHEAEDLTQEVYVRIGSRAGVSAIEDARAFAFTTAANLWRDRFRRRTCRGEEIALDAPEAMLADPRADPERAVAALEELESASAVLDALPAAARRAFVAFRVLGIAHAHIARELGVSVSMIEKHVMRAAAELRSVRP